MTRLERTTLTTPQKMEFAAELFARQGEYGAISSLSESFGVSRPMAYQAAETVRTLLHTHFDPAPAPEGVRVVVDEAQLKRAIIALRVKAPNSIRAIEQGKIALPSLREFPLADQFGLSRDRMC